jgi:hypothetical protein
VDLGGDGSARHRFYKSGPAPKLYTVALRQILGLRDSLFIVGANQRFEPREVTVIALCTGDIPASRWCPQTGRGQPLLNVSCRLSLPRQAKKLLTLNAGVAALGFLAQSPGLIHEALI